MANRTLRRAYSGTPVDAGIHAIASGSDEGSEPERGNGVEELNRESDSNGNIGERDSERDSSGIDTVEIDPTDLADYIASGSSDGSDIGDGTRKRRKRGPNKRTTGARKAAETVEPFLLMVHQWAAVFLKTPELALAEPEAKQLSDAYTEFCKYHDIPILSPKRMSEVNVIAALLLVYAPRFVAVKNRIKEETRAKKARNVTPIAAVN